MLILTVLSVYELTGSTYDINRNTTGCHLYKLTVYCMYSFSILCDALMMVVNRIET